MINSAGNQPQNLDVFWIRERTSTGRVTDWKIGVFDDWFIGFMTPGNYSPTPLESVVDMRGPIRPPADAAE